MAFKALKEIILLLIIVSTLLLPVAGSPRKLIIENSMVQVHMEAKAMMESLNNEKAIGAHQRMLRVNTKDYGSYDPAPAMDKPTFKPIPN
ncbi:hypothetical protein QJS04_geneDACA005105 [Acorus gramineus]|uniref:Uncharacterized protein n=1 Tax=Acorus gramineus TaxID=55184 RepID=A0AAV9AU84_ACOGR|nr:hypothetical protein QJS04_geneDACA005105 [Acorus gramineus]